MKIKITIAIIGLIIVGLLGMVRKTINLPKTINVSKITPAESNQLLGLRTGNYPWVSNLGELKARLNAIGLPALSAEGNVLHTHQHLDIYINGKQVDIADSIGRDEINGFIAPIHTHDNTGIIHVESPTIEKFTLGQFFDIWGLVFTDQCLGGYCAGNANQLTVYVNGQPITSDFRTIELLPHQEITIIYGNAKEVPSPIPSTYNFPPGY